MVSSLIGRLDNWRPALDLGKEHFPEGFRSCFVFGYRVGVQFIEALHQVRVLERSFQGNGKGRSGGEILACSAVRRGKTFGTDYGGTLVARL